ncbi:hypothetical protein OWM54_43005 [Myxococcus sp. MISCRS1]|uniref:hypothetical protein n=1 Tax=Myxococcus sp. MISCRS1 TaxID=2996786 RepID=UPI002270562F|nr:hypothetical protein [Myxococcus sp. MISCRS1]MCY1003935.1 hypothetical protein [Myxococcus sp. MISCRS1]
MIFRDKKQEAAVCRALLDTVDLGHIWTDEGPTEEARILKGFGIRKLDKREWLIFRIVWELWGEPVEDVRTSGTDVIRGLEGPSAQSVARLMLAYASGGGDGVDQWLSDATSQCYLDKAADERLDADINEAALANYNSHDPQAMELRERVNAARRRANEYEQKAVEAAAKAVERKPTATAQN